MKIETRAQFFLRCAMLALALVLPAAALTACSHAMLMAYHAGAKRPAPSEFGLGPRPAAGGRYVATPSSNSW